MVLADIKAFSCMYSQITAASDWPHLFCTLGTFVSIEYTEKAFTKLEPLPVIVPITFPFNP